MFGSDSDAVNAFMAMGKSILAEGGVFDVSFDTSMRVEEVYVQKPSLMPYARIYGDFTILDGTFNVCAYSLILMIFSNVDCVGKTTITGMTFAASESSESAVTSAQKFGLDREDSVLMTDGASAFAITAHGLKQTHMLCLHYF